MANAIAKRNAENEIEGMNLQTDSRRREALAKIAGIGGYDKSGMANMMRAGNIGLGVLSGMDAENAGELESFDFGFGNILEGIGNIFAPKNVRHDTSYQGLV